MVSSTEVGQRLETLGNQLKEADQQGMAARLLDLAGAVRGGPTAEQWAFTDLYRVVNPDEIAAQIAPPKSRLLLRLLEVFRSALVLAPLVLTWLGIERAVTAYSELVDSGSDLATQQFIYLWQNGFGGRTNLTLGTVAIWDVVILTLVVILTIGVHLLSAWLDGEDENAASVYESQIRGALADADLVLADRRRPEPGSTIREVHDLAREVFKDLNEEREVLRVLAENGVAQARGLGEFTAQLDAGSQTIGQAADSLRTANQSMEEFIKLLANSMSETRLLQERSLIPALRDTEAQLEIFSARLSDIVSAVEPVSTQTGQMFNTAQLLVGQMESGVKAMERSAAGVSALMGEATRIVQAVSAFTGQLRTATQDITAGMSTLRDAQTELSTNARGISQSVTRLGDQEARLGKDAREAGERLGKLVVDHLTSLEHQQRQLLPAVREASQGLTALAADQTSIVTKLETLTGQQQAMRDSMVDSMGIVATATGDAQDVARSLSSVSESLAVTLQNLFTSQAELVSTLQQERESQVHLSGFVSQATVSIEQAVRNISEVGVSLHGILVDLASLSQTMPTFSEAMKTIHRDIIQSTADKVEMADRISQAVDQLEASTSAADRAMRQFEPILRAMIGQTQALADSVDQFRRAAMS